MCFTVQLSRSLSCDSHIRLSHLFWLVKNFFHFLENFFFQDFQKFLRAPLSPTAMLEYHSVFPLSTSFLQFFQISFFIYFIPSSFCLYIYIFCFFPDVILTIDSTPCELSIVMNQLTPAADSQPPEPFLLTLLLTIQIHCQPAADFLLFYIIMERFFYLYFLERNITGYPRIQYL